MAKMAFLFPGQGAQYVGMGRELAEQFPSVQRHFDQAADLLGFDLAKLCWEGPEEELKKTFNQQPAILTLSVACLSLLTENSLKPDVVAGLSLGEYSALVAAGVLSFEQAVPLVRRRGMYMQDAVPLGLGGMAAILGLDTALIDEICAQVRLATGLVVEGANYNCPGQVVISGHTEAVEQAMALVSQGGGKAVKLSVTAPFHSSLLTPAGEMLTSALHDVTIHDAQVPVVANVTADYVTEGAVIRDLLIRQVSKPVRWEESVRRMLADGVDTFIEVGPSKTLSGFMKKIDRKVTMLNIDDAQSLGKVLDSCGRVC
ncbi:MAG TPA: ACP S-malonyltransferase [Symbiobacteriaceae bacterium]|nr:ACP S-malonyltransferase [Symbiobacteriaceae bacterium]